MCMCWVCLGFTRNECGENLPRFVSHYFYELLPVTFKSPEISSLLGRIEQMQLEVCDMKHVMKMQTSCTEELHVATLDLN